MKVSWFLHLVEHWPQRVTNNLLSKLFKGIFLLLSFLVINYRRNLFSHLVRFLGRFFTNNIQDFLSLNNSSCSSNFTSCFTSLSSSLFCWTTSLAMQSLLVFTTANTNICCPTFHIFRSLQALGQDLFVKRLFWSYWHIWQHKKDTNLDVFITRKAKSLSKSSDV